VPPRPRRCRVRRDACRGSAVGCGSAPGTRGHLRGHVGARRRTAHARGDRAVARSRRSSGRSRRGRCPSAVVQRLRAAALARGTRGARRHDVGRRGPLVGRRRSRHPRGASRADARRHTARSRRPARPHRRAQREPVREPRAARRRARHCPHGRARSRAPRALLSLGTRAHPIDLRAPRGLHRRLARPAAPSTRPRPPHAVRCVHDVDRGVLLAARLAGTRHARRGDARAGRLRPPASAGRRSPRIDRRRDTRGAGSRPLGGALGGGLAVAPSRA